ncbi:apolipoprotein N-acyltransferase [filamentous cyanobacterium LEGE 11480]|uniref:Apolipoprotein N-acyltransferase n=2 Tax=Romeriopsis TaxID=2992131 RepID=A0A928VGV2_9CYAN|nr:apolipoprotein N-acyltransferase [Romeriopsis navalis LEGE 11480]
MTAPPQPTPTPEQQHPPQRSWQQRLKWRSLLALLSGLTMSLAPAPLNWWGFAWVSLIPLWWIVFPQAPGQTAGAQRRGIKWPLICWSLAYHGISLSWITGLHPLTWMGIPWAGSVAIVAFAWTFITGWGIASVLLWGSGLRWLERQFTLNAGERVLAGVALWCTIEAGRSLTPLDWTALSYTQSPGNLWLLHLGQLSGNLTISALIVAVNGLVAEALRPANLKLPPKGLYPGGWRWQVPRSTMLTAAFTTLIVSHSIGAALYFQPLNNATNQALNIGIIQGNIPTRIKLSGAGIKQAIRNYTNGYRELAQQGVDAVLTPEGALPFNWEQEKPAILEQAIAQTNIPLWLGSFGRARGNDGKLRPTQRLFSLDATGQTISHYDKVKLVPLGESMPLEPILGKVIGRLSPLRSFLLPGHSHQIFETEFGRAAIGICYESAFPHLFRNQVKQGANLIITASNLDPYSEVLMAQHQAHDIMRSIELDRWAVRATNTGYSSIITPHGKVVWRSTPHQLVSHSDRVYRRHHLTPYTQLGNWLTPLLVVGLGVKLGVKRSA